MSLDLARNCFRERFGVEATIFAFAPGRINLIGEHTDYNEGFVFPVAVDQSLYVAARPTDASESRVFSLETGEGKPFDVRTVEPKLDGWTDYAAGMAWAIRIAVNGAPQNFDAVVSSTIPIGSGVSSSAAIELGFGVVIREIERLKLTNKELALLGQQCENKFVGVSSGVMDQMASAMGRPGKAMFLDTRSLEITYAGVPEELTVVVCDTKTPRALTASAYNERRSQCEEASRILEVKALRDASLEMLEAKQDAMTPVVFRRARHVISENQRCQEFVPALEHRDFDQIGALMRASHESLRDDYEVSSRELDFMAEAAWQAAGCVGARMTGAGFGGACVALVETGQVEQFRRVAESKYAASSGLKGELSSAKIVEGAHIVQT